ncbi:MAG: hypothetical protein WBD50_07935 [Candidatus Rhabdochlamydia sp.]
MVARSDLLVCPINASSFPNAYCLTSSTSSAKIEQKESHGELAIILILSRVFQETQH